MSLHKKCTTQIDEALEILERPQLLAARTEFDEDLPGCGEFYCVLCDRYFVSEADKVRHEAEKVHKKRVYDAAVGGWDDYDAQLARCPAPPDNGIPVQKAPAPDPFALVPELREKRKASEARLAALASGASAKHLGNRADMMSQSQRGTNNESRRKMQRNKRKAINIKRRHP